MSTAVASRPMDEAHSPGAHRGVRADAISRLGWGARHWAAVLVPLLVNCLTVALLVTADERRDDSYRAEALIVASQLEVPHRHLARLGQTVFASPTLAAKVYTRLQLAPDFGSLIPEHITMKPVPNSIVYVVQARAADPEWAILMANTAADAFVEELNRVGDGVGTFRVQTRAAEPLAQSVAPLSLPVALGVALVAGALLLVSLLALLLRWRRPLLTAAEVSDIVDAPVIAAPAVPRSFLAGRRDPEKLDRLSRSPGFAVLAAALGRVADPAVVLTGNSETLELRRTLAQMLNARHEVRRLRVLIHEDATVPELATTPRVLVVTKGAPTQAVSRHASGSEAGTAAVVFLSAEETRGSARSRGWRSRTAEGGLD